MTRYYCDVCGKQISMVSNTCIVKVGNGSPQDQSYISWHPDIILCPECSFKLHEFLKISTKRY